MPTDAAPTILLRRVAGIALWLAGLCVQAEPLRFTTENYPPFNMSLDDGETIIGISTEQLREALRRTGLSAQIVLYPWVRAYRMALDDADTCVYSTTRTPEREPSFKWVGPLVDNDWVLLARPENTKVLTRLEDVGEASIGTYLGDAVSDYLHARNLNVTDATNDQQNAKKLALGRIEYWATGRLLGSYLTRQAQLPPFQEKLIFNRTQMYLACNPSVPDKIIQALNHALSAMRADGTVARIEHKYLQRPAR
jgi:polar amino acid transport system substrate-binding protein